jgi:hypothetical protein
MKRCIKISARPDTVIIPYGPRIVRETCEKCALLARFSHICLLCGKHVFGTFKSVRFMCVLCAFYVRFLCALNVLELCVKCCALN